MNRPVVYTLTFHEVLNVGATLQAYALQKFIVDSGYETAILNYKPWYFIWQIYRPAKGLVKAIRKYKVLFKFRCFRKRHMKITSRSFRHVSEFREFDHCSAIVCGSDQIWNPTLTGGKYDPVFFLGCPMQAHKIAYAASAGGHAVSPGACAIGPHLKEFRAVGVREECLREDLESSGLAHNVEVVLDPIFLIRNYDEVADVSLVPQGVNYIATYEVGSAESRTLINQYAATLRRVTGFPIHHLGAKAIRDVDVFHQALGPSEWLGLMKNAAIVCTNSFHGMAFALNFRRKLVFVPHLEEERNARSFSLLQRCGLSKLICHGNDSLLSHPWADNYETTQLESLISSSKQFLIQNLGVSRTEKSRTALNGSEYSRSEV